MKGRCCSCFLAHIGTVSLFVVMSLLFQPLAAYCPSLIVLPVTCATGANIGTLCLCDQLRGQLNTLLAIHLQTTVAEAVPEWQALLVSLRRVLAFVLT